MASSFKNLRDKMPAESRLRSQNKAAQYRKPPFKRPEQPKPALVVEAQAFVSDIRQQIKAEVGDDELTAAQSFILKQKFGLVVATAIPVKEIRLMKREADAGN